MKLVKTKTFWAGLASVITGVGIAVGGDLNTGIQTAITGLLAIFTRDAIKKAGG